MTRRSITAGAAVAVALLVATSAQANPHKPDTYVVSNEADFQPEGIGVTNAGVIYVSSIGTGDIYRGHVKSTEFELFSDGAAVDRERSLGVHSDDKGRVFVAGVSHLDVYAADGTLLAHRPAAAGPIGDPELNDLAITHDAVYVTDSTNAVIWRASLEGGEIGQLERWFDARDVYPGFPPQFFFLNGIAASPAGDVLLVSSQGLESLIRVDVRTGDSQLVDLGDHTYGPDGIELRGNTVFGVLNYAAPNDEQGVYVAQLNDDYTTGTVTCSVVEEDFDTPSTLGLSRNRILVVNSQIDNGLGTPPYTISSVRNPVGVDGSGC